MMNNLNKKFFSQDPKLKVIFIGVIGFFILYFSGYIIGQFYYYFKN